MLALYLQTQYQVSVLYYKKATIGEQNFSTNKSNWKEKKSFPLFLAIDAWKSTCENLVTLENEWMARVLDTFSGYLVFQNRPKRGDWQNRKICLL